MADQTATTSERSLGERYGDVLARMDAAYAAWKDAGYPFKGEPTYEAKEALYVELRALNAEANAPLRLVQTRKGPRWERVIPAAPVASTWNGIDNDAQDDDPGDGYCSACGALPDDPHAIGCKWNDDPSLVSTGEPVP